MNREQLEAMEHEIWEWVLDHFFLSSFVSEKELTSQFGNLGLEYGCHNPAPLYFIRRLNLPRKRNGWSDVLLEIGTDYHHGVFNVFMRVPMTLTPIMFITRCLTVNEAKAYLEQGFANIPEWQLYLYQEGQPGPA